MKNELLAIDPGRDQGWAVFKISDRSLVRCGLGSAKEEDFAAIVIECPQVYKHSKANPTDVIKLAIRVGIQINRFRESPAYLVTPHAWKGSAPKEIHAGRILSKLNTEELHVLGNVKAPAGKKHNVIDAIGLGKWALDNRSMWPMLMWQ